jgi:hypothetical protein
MEIDATQLQWRVAECLQGFADNLLEKPNVEPSPKAAVFLKVGEATEKIMRIFGHEMHWMY